MKIRKPILPPLTLAMTIVSLGFLGFFITYNPLASAAQPKSDQHLVTIFDRGKEMSVISKKDTLREVLEEKDINLGRNDVVEPGLDEELVASSYKVNIYRARPVTVIDGKSRVRVMSAHQTPSAIVKDTKLPKLQQEDDAEFRLPSSVLAQGASLELVIDRALPIKLVLYGKEATVYTQATTVDEFLADKDIAITEKDTLSVKRSRPLKANMTIEIWRNGTQVVTKKEAIKPGTRTIEDADHKVGYRKVEKAGVAGQKLVTYHLTMKNGKMLKRKVIKTVIVKPAKDEVVRVGTKPSFSGGFAEALAKLRSCEGGYGSWNPAGPYYGAYQFDRGTWNSVSSAPYGDATPAEQDAAARALYERRGWSPWPHCGAGLPDIYR